MFQFWLILDVENAARAAQIHDRIQEFPEKYETIIGENGKKLSSGELQRIAIARTILKRPSIWVLDEPTSNLDNEMQENVVKSLAELAEGCTVFILAHRLCTITRADLIVYLRDSQIVEQGTHRDLINKRGEYFKMWEKEICERELSSLSANLVGESILKRYKSTNF